MESRNDSLESAKLLLNEIETGKETSAEQLMLLVYDELRKLAQMMLESERANHTLQATALVNEAYLRMLGQSNVSWQSRAHFRAIAARMIRRVLVDYSRAKNTAKRGGQFATINLDNTQEIGAKQNASIDILELNETLEGLAQLNHRQSQVVELRFFAGMSVEETSEVLNVSERTVKDDWRFAKAWLRSELGGLDDK